jgi:hypothetical protein
MVERVSSKYWRVEVQLHPFLIAALGAGHPSVQSSDASPEGKVLCTYENGYELFGEDIHLLLLRKTVLHTGMSGCTRIPPSNSPYAFMTSTGITLHLHCPEDEHISLSEELAWLFLLPY